MNSPMPAVSTTSRAGKSASQAKASNLAPLLGDQELSRYNLANVLRYLVDPAANARGCGLELDISSRARTTGRAGDREDGVFIPVEVLVRDLVVGTPTAGGHLVSTDVHRDKFIDLLRPASAVISAGAQVIGDLSGNVAIPRMTAGAAIQWVAENSSPTEGAPTFDQVTLSPKTAAGYVDIGRRLIIQTGADVSRFISADLRAGVATAIDLAAIAGTGASNQPRGILQTVGVGVVVGGTNGAAPTYDHVVDLEASVANQNTLIERPGYVTNSRVRARLEKTQMFGVATGAPVWTSTGDGDRLKGRSAFVSNNVPNNLTKGTSAGVCSAIVYGNWLDLLIGLWGGGITVMADPYTLSTIGGLRLVVLVDCDVAVRYSSSFSIMNDALTA